MSHFKFSILTRSGNARAGVYETPHGSIETPAFVTVATLANVKGVPLPMLEELKPPVVLANTYHLFLRPGDDVVREAGGFSKFMGWDGPSMTDSGGFQVFSLGAAFGSHVSKVAQGGSIRREKNLHYDQHDDTQELENSGQLAHIDEDGVTFRSHINGDEHRFTPERSMEIQWNLGADIIFSFDECTSPHASYEYQIEALERTLRWADRCCARHAQLDPENRQALFGVIQGGRFEDLRKRCAHDIAEREFDGFGIGGSFNKDDLATAVSWVTSVLPEEKPRHLLGIGDPFDVLKGIQHGCDFFDCVSPTRVGRHGIVYTYDGPIRIRQAQYARDFSSLDPELATPHSEFVTKAYVHHLHRADEILGGTLASLHNLNFMITLVRNAREALFLDRFENFVRDFTKRYYKGERIF